MMERHARTIPLRLDERIPEEQAVLNAYDEKIKGRRIDFLRQLVIIGYQSLYGKEAPPTLFGKDAGTKGRTKEKATSGTETSEATLDNASASSEVPENLERKPKTSLNLNNLIGDQR